MRWGICAALKSFADSEAVGDGATDDKAALQSFVDANPRSMFIVPAGVTYAVSDSLKLGNYQAVSFGPGGKILLTVDAVGKGAITNADKANGNRRVGVFNAHIKGSSGGGQTGHTGGANGIFFRNVEYIKVHASFVEEVGGVGIAYQKAKHVDITNTETHKTGRDGISGWGLNGVLEDVRVVDCIAYWPGDDGFAFNANEDGSDGLLNGTGDTFTTTAGSGTVTLGTGGLVAGDVGKRIQIAWAGDATENGSDLGFTYKPYEGYITAVTNSTTCTVSPVVPRSVTSAEGRFRHNKPKNILLKNSKTIGRNYENDDVFGRGVLLAGTDGVTVEGCEFRDTYASGVLLSHVLYTSGAMDGQHLFATNNVIRDCTITGAGAYGDFEDPEYGRQGGYSVQISGGDYNLIENITESGSLDGSYGLHLTGSNNTINGG